METRKDYIARLAEKLRAWDDKIDELRDRTDGATADLKIRYKQELVELKEIRERAARHMTEVREAGGDAWKALKEDFDKKIKQVKESFKKAA